MALQKEILFTCGVTVNYHMINDVQVDNKSKTIKIEVASYTDETYRQKEIDNLNRKQTYEDAILKIFEENVKPEEERDVELVNQLSATANDLVGKFSDELDLKVTISKYEFEDIVDYSMEQLYAKLKEQELFKDSIDV